MSKSNKPKPPKSPKGILWRGAIWHLAVTEDGLRLFAQGNTATSPIVTVQNAGDLVRHAHVDSGLGLRLNADGQIELLA